MVYFSRDVEAQLVIVCGEEMKLPKLHPYRLDSDYQLDRRYLLCCGQMWSEKGICFFEWFDE
jgi:hypothetical protein